MEWNVAKKKRRKPEPVLKYLKKYNESRTLTGVGKRRVKTSICLGDKRLESTNRVAGNPPKKKIWKRLAAPVTITEMNLLKRNVKSKDNTRLGREVANA